MSRWKNYGLWLAVFSLVGIILTDKGIIDAGKYNTYVTSIMTILVGAGIVNNPSLGNGYRDGEQDDKSSGNE